MSIMDDEVDRLLKRIDEERHRIADLLVHGGVSSENVADGYRDVTGQIKGLDKAEDIVREVFATWLPPKDKAPSVVKRYLGEY